MMMPGEIQVALCLAVLALLVLVARTGVGGAFSACSHVRGHGPRSQA